MEAYRTSYQMIVNKFPGIDRDGLEDLYKRNLELIDIRVALNNHPLKKIPIKYNKTDQVDTTKLRNLLKEYKLLSFLTPDFIKTFENLKSWKNF